MGAICRLFGHRASAATIWNDGRHFGRCTRCDTEIVRDRTGWVAPPPGYRIVWRDRQAGEPDWSRWNPQALGPATRRPKRPEQAVATLKVVGEAPERRDPASPGHDGLLGGKRGGDRRRAA